jgi:hypothetical protein
MAHIRNLHTIICVTIPACFKPLILNEAVEFFL